MTPADDLPPTFGHPASELAPAIILGGLERDWEKAELEWRRTRTPEAWERLADLERTIRGHCRAYGLFPSVGVEP